MLSPGSGVLYLAKEALMCCSMAEADLCLLCWSTPVAAEAGGIDLALLPESSIMLGGWPGLENIPMTASASACTDSMFNIFEVSIVVRSKVLLWNWGIIFSSLSPSIAPGAVSSSLGILCPRLISIDKSSRLLRRCSLNIYKIFS